jgi:hypothetical protein
MAWLTILQLAFTLLAQALAAFGQGVRKEDPHTVVLDDVHKETVRSLLQ